MTAAAALLDEARRERQLHGKALPPRPTPAPAKTVYNVGQAQYQPAHLHRVSGRPRRCRAGSGAPCYSTRRQNELPASSVPAPVAGDGFIYSFVALIAAIGLTLAVRRYAVKRQAETGQILPMFWIGLSIIIVLPLLVHYLNGAPLDWILPEFKDTGPKLRQGYQSGVGMLLVPEMLAVWLSLSLYTAAFIAEIVRAGILAVNRGQTEAAFALGVRPNITLRLVIIPQAMRVIIPPLTSQYLNLTKNSSLAVAIAYPELVSVFAGTALNQVGKEIEMIFMMMMVYLTFSLLTAAFMNWFNSRVKLVER